MIARDPRSIVNAHWERAETALAAKHWRRALQGARAVAVIMPGLARPLMLCSMCQAPLGLPERALNDVRRANMTDPADALILTRLSEALYAAGNFIAAEAAIREALCRGVAGGEGHFLLAKTLWIQGEIEPARLALDTAVSLDPTLSEKRRILEYTVRPGDFD
ncbi:MAG: hypothetical protein OSB69_21310 [Alphaproteobacteria bacterium]|nr:hypothetical protein [Alphaproteobacteria bacterium]